ncbi:MAG: CDP-diacylglycerol--serine O-phosphatidyltransferase [Acidobacteria bacterium]|nr:CDP-diacylglycerol--serine O-phosphatidyltransferase [Acidobacteriota bacterium]
MRPRRFPRGDSPPYALPALFTAGTLFCGYYTLMKTVQAISLPPEAAEAAARLYDHAAIAVGLAVFTDGLDGRVARATGAVSDFGREIDSLADCITFGAAPATLAFAWGIRAPEMQPNLWLAPYLPGLGYLLSFLFLLCGAARLARFNVQRNPRPKNPGRPGKRYFVGMPIPAAAGVLASIVHARGGQPIENWWPAGVLWLGLIGLLAFLMVSTWRFSSFKNLSPTASPVLNLVFLGAMIYLIWNFSQPVLLAMAGLYMLSGLFNRCAWWFKRDKQSVLDAIERAELAEEAEQQGHQAQQGI